MNKYNVDDLEIVTTFFIYFLDKGFISHIYCSLKLYALAITQGNLHHPRSLDMLIVP